MQPVFVGDVQGCADELEQVVERAASEFGRRFELWVVGDLVNRGPDNLRALRLVRELVEAKRAHYVLGNHEVALLQCALGTRRVARGDTFTDVLEARDRDDWVDWLRARPLAAFGRLGEQEFVMLHAAAHPDWGLAELSRRARRASQRLAGDREQARAFLAKQPGGRRRDTLDRMTSCRSVTGTDWSPEPPRDGAVAWHQDWSQRGHDYGVVYGHWSLQGLHVAPGLRGLDTGCVHHGRDGDRWLTAWVPDPRSKTPFGVPDRCFWKVPARRVYYAARARA